MKELPAAAELMSTPASITNPEMDIFDGMQVLAGTKCSAAAVLDENHVLVGLLTEKDCLRVLSNIAYDGGSMRGAGKVKDYMSTVKATLTPTMDVFSISSVFLSTNFTHLPVLDEGRLVGWLSRQRMLRAVIEMQEQLQVDGARFREYQASIKNPTTSQDAAKIVANESPDAARDLLSRPRPWRG